jgi:hypothetical protein
MTEEHPRFIDVAIEDKFIIRFNRIEEMRDGQYAYACKGTAKDLQALQEHIDDVYPHPRTNS